jgi:hypothetical protein
MGKIWLKIAGWFLVIIGGISGLAVLFSLFTFSQPGYQSGGPGSGATVYAPFVLLGIVITVAHIFLGINLIKLKKWAISSTLVFSAILALLFLWGIMMGQTVRNDYIRLFFYFFSEKNVFLLIAYVACSIITLSNLSYKSEV